MLKYNSVKSSTCVIVKTNKQMFHGTFVYGGIYRASTQQMSYSTEDTFESVNYMGSNSCMELSSMGLNCWWLLRKCSQPCN